MFKVPSLRDVAKTYPYFHDGSVASLDQAVEIMAKAQLDQSLSKNEVTSIMSFLKSLTNSQENPKMLSSLSSSN